MIKFYVFNSGTDYFWRKPHIWQEIWISEISINSVLQNQAFKSNAAQFVYQEMMSLMNEAKQNKNIPRNWKTIKSSILKSDQNMLVAASKQKSDIQQQNNSSAPLVNLVICPICKETLWGAQKYSDHLRTVHGDKNQNEGSPKLPLIRVKIPLYKQRKYKSQKEKWANQN